MQSSSIPVTTAPTEETRTMLRAMAARRDLALTEEALTAAATLDAWLAPHQLQLRGQELSFLQLVEPANTFQWLEQHGRSVTPPAQEA
ncbi:MAG: hypothetical protein JWP14_422 [Frankiales bacterium]|jgi:hypothetical protein|nr:hypothetical protein [Frankiales bacterium]